MPLAKMPDNAEKVSRESTRKIALIHQAHPQAGGAATYESNLSELVREISLGSKAIVLEFSPPHSESRGRKRGDSLTTEFTYQYSSGFLQLLHILLLAIPFARTFMSLLGFGTTKLERHLKQLGVNLAYFSSPNPLALGLHDIPIVSTVWDLGHRDLPKFSEFSSKGRWLAREFYYRKTVLMSAKIVTDSIATGRKLEKIYGLLPEKWVPLGLLPKVTEPSTNLDILPKTNYIIYPAQKWRHKNHEVLYKALQLLREEGQEVVLVETGSDKGYADSLRKLAKDLKVEDLVLDLGFVEASDLALLIKSSRALVMPSLLGPTNLPPLEAVAMGVPAIVSDIHEFDGDLMACFTVTRADSPSDWAAAIKDAVLRQNEARLPLVFDSANAAKVLETIICNED